MNNYTPQHAFSVGDKVVVTNTFGVCWGIRTIVKLGWLNGPEYYLSGMEAHWASWPERQLTLPDTEDIIMDTWFHQDRDFFQQKYGFTPTEWFGCY